MAHRGVALITGGCGGLGLSFADRWLRTGGRLVKLVDLAPRAAADNAVSRLVAAHGAGKVEYVETDVTDSDALSSVFAGADGDGGRDLGLVVNNAGVGALGFEQWRAQLDVNLAAVVDGTRLALEVWGARGSAAADAREGEGDRVVVNVASMAGLIPLSPSPVYSATKFGVVGFSRAMHADARRTHGRSVRVHALCPSFARTGMMNEELMEADEATAKIVAMFGGLLTPDGVADATFEKLVDARDAKPVLHVTPLTGAAYDEPPSHPIESAVRNAYLRKVGVVEAARVLLGFKKKKK